MKRTIENILIAGVVGVCGYLSVTAWFDMQSGWASESWPTTTGVVTKTEMQSSSGHRTGTTYYPTITYRYEVDGTDYESSRLGAYRHGSSRRKAEVKLGAYPVASEHVVHYNPADPTEAVLITGVHWQNHLVLYGAAGVGVIAALGLIGRLRETHQPVESEDMRQYGSVGPGKAGHAPPRPPRDSDVS